MLDLLSNITLCALPERRDEAERLAARFNLPLAEQHRNTRYKLWLGIQRLELQDCQPDAPGPVYVDFTEGRAVYRRQYGGGKNQPLARAIGCKSIPEPRVIDATAGLGRDSFVMASLGCHVTLIERSPVMAALLFDGIERATLHSDTETIANNMQLICADARQYLDTLAAENRPDTIYMDPMYPHRSKSALVKKEMRITRAMVGNDEDAGELLETARSKALKRVVVKRPGHADTLTASKPSTSIKSKKTRYDVYITTV